MLCILSFDITQIVIDVIKPNGTKEQSLTNIVKFILVLILTMVQSQTFATCGKIRQTL